MAERVTVIVEAKDAASGVLRGITSQLGSLGNVVDDLTTKNINWGNVAQSATILAINAFKEFVKFAREGADLEFTALKFDRLAESIGTTADVLMDDLRSATRGTMSDMELMASVTDLVGLGLANSADEAVRLATVSSGLGMNMNQLVLTLTNMTTMRFDALGVRVDGFKEKVAALEAQGYSTDAAFKEAFLQQAEEQLLLVGNAADTAAGQFKILDANIKNSADQLKMMAADALLPAVQGYNKLYEAQSALEDQGVSPYLAHRMAIMGIAVESENAANTQTDLAGAIDDSAASASNAATDYGKLLSLAQKLNDATRDQIQLAGYQELQDVFAKSDGGISPEEAALLQEAGVSMGIFSQQSADAAASIQDFAQQVEAGTKGLDEYILLLNSIPTDVYTTIHQNTITSGSIHEDTGNGGPLSGGRASGGPVDAGKTYLVGEQGPELFTPKTSGDIIPNDKMGGVNNFYGASVYVTLEGSNFMDSR